MDATAARIPAAVNDWLIQLVTIGNHTVGVKNVGGSYVHSSLIVHIACWVNSDFAFLVSQIVNNFFITEYKERLAAQIEFNNALSDINEVILCDITIAGNRSGRKSNADT